MPGVDTVESRWCQVLLDIMIQCLLPPATLVTMEHVSGTAWSSYICDVGLVFLNFVIGSNVTYTCSTALFANCLCPNSKSTFKQLAFTKEIMFLLARIWIITVY